MPHSALEKEGYRTGQCEKFDSTKGFHGFLLRGWKTSDRREDPGGGSTSSRGPPEEEEEEEEKKEDVV
ncbi:hypothetical protein KM043_015347 [Ampulex compressa]|nr:hypothetical protein KM043_015347 [Ampulex compressa]